jgi:hypothetical protein
MGGPSQRGFSQGQARLVGLLQIAGYLPTRLTTQMIVVG